MTALASDLVVRSLAVTFRSGTTIAEHRHRWGQLVVVARGAMRVTAVSQVWITPPTRALWLPAGVPHRLCAVGAEVALRTLYLAEPLSQALPAQPSVREVSPLLRELVLHILSLGMLAGSQPAQARLAQVLVDLVAQAGAVDLQLPLPADPRARALADRLLAQPGERVALAALADNVGASLRTLQRAFARETGLPIEAWRSKASLLHAAARLAEGASVTEAAGDAGWQSLAGFGAAFRQVFGMTPGRYRARRGQA
ncbi:AraC family transcriptional regulator [Roseateles puraquae]|uniref:AraC family transcriptional regulator n=1 Tax=Roseateles puraquae TaxID=431059 RepID=UPI0031D292D4